MYFFFLKVYKETVDWSSENGKKLEESLILSEKAKKFAIAEQLYYISSPEVLVKTLITIFIVNLTVLYFHSLKTFFKEKKITRGWPIYLVLVITKFALWLILKDGYTCYLEDMTDKKIAELGKDYVEGGVEFFEKVLQTNQVLKDFAEEKGKKSEYTLFGNREVIYSFFHNTLDEFENLSSAFF